MALKATRRKNIVFRDGKRIRLPDVPGVSIERELWDAGVAHVVGVDEVGRGSWAGPVTVGACVLPAGRRIYKVRDSKLLDARRREELAAKLEGYATAWGVGHASHDEVDSAGIGGALKLAASRALAQVESTIECGVILLDGTWNYLGDERVRTVKHGDSVSLTIASASIMAKVSRDARMVEYDAEHPGYGFAGHKGYSCSEHDAALERLGPSPIHRRTFGPVAAALGKTPAEIRAEASGQLSLSD